MGDSHWMTGQVMRLFPFQVGIKREKQPEGCFSLLYKPVNNDPNVTRGSG